MAEDKKVATKKFAAVYTRTYSEDRSYPVRHVCATEAKALAHIDAARKASVEHGGVNIIGAAVVSA